MVATPCRRKGNNLEANPRDSKEFYGGWEVPNEENMDDNACQRLVPAGTAQGTLSIHRDVTHRPHRGAMSF